MLIDPSSLVTRYGLSPGRTEVLLSEEESLVAKCETDRGPVVVKAKQEGRRPADEYATNSRLAGLGLPVANVLGYGEAPVPHIVLAWLPGTELSSQSPISAQREAGALLRRVHELGGGPPYAGNDAWDVWMEGWLNHALPWWQATFDISEDRIAAAWSGFESIRPVLSTRGSGFMLFDGRPEHFLIQGGSVTGMIDLEEARAGDAAMDLGVMAVSDPDLLKGVLEGYEPTPEEMDVFELLIPFYVFLRRLAAVEWNMGIGDAEKVTRVVRLFGETPIPGDRMELRALNA